MKVDIFQDCIKYLTMILFKLADDVRSSLVDQIVEGKGLDISHVKKFLQDEQGKLFYR